MLIIAVLNGTARDLLYKKYTGELPGHQISTISLLILFSFYIAFIIEKLPPNSERQAMSVGMLWLLLTLIFEFCFGLIRGNSLTSLWSDYNIFKGRIWILILIWTTIAPYLFFKMTTSK